jgi:hypothetical protein
VRIAAIVLAVLVATLGATVSGLAAPLLPPLRLWPAPTTVPTPAASPTPAGWREADAVVALRAILRARGYPESVVRGPMAAWPPGGRELAEAGIVGDVELEELLAEPWPAEAWLVCTNAGCWWVWAYGTAAPGDREAQTRELLHRARLRLSGIDAD